MALTFVVALAVMYAAHNVADHVFGQTDKVAANKSKPGRVGWLAILQHVASYHIVMLVMLWITFIAVDVSVSLPGLIAGLLFSAVTHAILDRRWPVKWILERTGSPAFAQLTQPLCGMYLADQALHCFCLWISALLIACL